MEYAPSYLTCRKGIYYFQFRVPQRLKASNRLPALIRRSTRTGNKKEAINIARYWLYKLMNDQDDTSPPKDWYAAQLEAHGINEAEEDYIEELIQIGKAIFFDVAAIDKDDSYSIKEYMGNLSDTQIEAFKAYADSISPDKAAQITKEAKEHYKQVRVMKDAFPTLGNVTHIDPIDRNISINTSSSTISQAMEDYLDKKKGEITLKTSRRYRASITLLTELIGNIFVNSITPDLMRDKAISRLKYLPRNRDRKEYKSYSDINKLIDASKISNMPKISSTTLNGYLGEYSVFFRWLKDSRYVTEDFSGIFEAHKSKNDKDELDVLAFTNEEMKKIFENPSFGGNKKKYPSRYWGTLLAAYTGARVGEIAQLYLEDIYQDVPSGIWMISFNRNHGKRLKTEVSIRECPLHDHLIQLGFLEYCDQLRKLKEERLFEELKANPKGDDVGRKINRWFNETYRKQLGISVPEGKRKSFHSFRHYLVAYSQRESLNDPVLAQMMGHSTGQKTVRQKHYQKPYPATILKAELDKVNFGIDLNTLIRNSE